MKKRYSVDLVGAGGKGSAGLARKKARSKRAGKKPAPSKGRRP